MVFKYGDLKPLLNIQVYKWIKIKHLVVVGSLMYCSLAPYLFVSERIRINRSMASAWDAVEARRAQEIERIKNDPDLSPDIVVPPGK